MFSDTFQCHFPTPPAGDYLTVIDDTSQIDHAPEYRYQVATSVT